ncbi:uncharacterized protein BDR25DRAFT_262499 [Lindgomyces ingoldianus]|uniref:Uncharacterized protein n=1 Tax=Lindgomyces ingoldianus TaxID=673940 RepID=A0ACB6QSE8_9PLEO|nr:uncharacterized protein BDR25DRAFT_262499 [Lindgomyces ingoldianus]KAF2469938.1 hypothetical protein BDR25DRAFT_262499 [Lindgomyces ingoldianus]
MSTTDLKRKYEMCARRYLRIIQSNSGSTGNVERVALDGIRFVLICRTLGISNARLDPVLARYQQYLLQDLERLHYSLESVEGSAIALKEDHAKSQALTSWVTDMMVESEELRVRSHLGQIHDETDDHATISEPFQDRISKLTNTSSSVLESLHRLLSESQKREFSREIHNWQTKVLVGDNVVALNALRAAVDSLDSPSGLLASEVNQRLHVIAEARPENKINASLIQRLQLRTEDLHLAISQEEQERYLETVASLEGSHAVSRFHGKIVFVEKRRNLDSACEGEKAIEIFLRVESLAERLAKTPKPEALCTLNLLNTFSDRTDQNYGFIYAWPWDIESWDERLKPKTLHQLLVESGRDLRDVGPSLTHRFEIARRLANCVRIFHRIGWLHKSISSHNVLFFPRNLGDDPFEMEDGMFLVGFEYSRQDGRNFVTEPVTKEGTYDIYRHPDVTAFERRSTVDDSEPKIFEKRHDLYALGLLLMEIGLWDTMESLQQVQQNEGQAAVHIPTPQEFFKQLNEGGKGSAESLLRFHTGDRYTDATMTCLRGEVRDGNHGVEYFEDFYTKILECLGYSLT